MVNSLLTRSRRGNTEAQRAQSFGSRLSSVTSVPLCFNLSLNAKLEQAIKANLRGLCYDG